MDALQLLEGAIEGALQAGFVAAQGVEEPGALAVGAKDLGFVVVAIAGVFAGLAEVGAGVEVLAGFDAADAAKTPGGGDHLLDQNEFHFRLRVVLLFEGGGEVDQVVFVWFFEIG